MSEQHRILDLKEARDPNSCGGRAAGLAELDAAGFRIPAGFVLPRELITEILENYGRSGKLRGSEELEGKAGEDETGRPFAGSDDPLFLPGEVEKSIRSRLREGSTYGIFLSDPLEWSPLCKSSDEVSFHAVRPENVIQAVLEAIARQVSDDAPGTPAAAESLRADHCRAVLVQEEIQADLSGAAYTVDPLTGNDHGIIFETVHGSSRPDASSPSRPERSLYDWFQDKAFPASGGTLMDRGRLRVMGKRLLKMQVLFGQPLKVEFAVSRNRNFVLRVRPLKEIRHAGLKEQWSKADLRDGSLSVRPSSAILCSVCELAWEEGMKSFMEKSGLLKDGELPGMARTFFARPYWNLSFLRHTLSRIPGFQPGGFARAFGITGTLRDPYRKPGLSPARIAGNAVIALKQNSLLKEWDDQKEKLQKELIQIYEDRLAALKDLSGRELERAWTRLIREDFLKSETAFLYQILISAVPISNDRDAVLKLVDTGTFHRLLGGLSEIPQLKPFPELWELSRSLRNESTGRTFWLETDPAELSRLVQDGTGTEPGMSRFRELVERYGYHSGQEPEVSCPHLSEDPTVLIHSLRDYMKLSDEYSPGAAERKAVLDYLKALKELETTHSGNPAAQIRRKTDRIRSHLRRREEYREISLMYYHLIRLYTKKLGEELQVRGMIGDAEDIWFLRIQEIQEILDGRRNVEKTAWQVKRNRNYYESFRNFNCRNEIGEGLASLKKSVSVVSPLRGLPVSSGILSAPVSVRKAREEFIETTSGGILAVPYTDFAWTSLLATRGGIVTESGSPYSHAAVLSREFGIPCIVRVPWLTEILSDGEIIKMDAGTGEIRTEMS